MAENKCGRVKINLFLASLSLSLDIYFKGNRNEQRDFRAASRLCGRTPIILR